MIRQSHLGRVFETISKHSLNKKTLIFMGLFVFLRIPSQHINNLAASLKSKEYSILTPLMP